VSAVEQRFVEVLFVAFGSGEVVGEDVLDELFWGRSGRVGLNCDVF
jgi:hypothetical protein